jgi:hypothetical protein
MKQLLRIQLLMALSLLLIPLSGFSQKTAQTGTTPAPLPKLKSTGNAEVDKASYEQAVKAWKEKERQRIERLQIDDSQKNVSTSPATLKSKAVKDKQDGKGVNQRVSPTREVTILDLPGYPKYVATGDPSRDEKVYQEAKAKWIDENSALYKSYVEQHSAKSGKLKRRTPETSK